MEENQKSTRISLTRFIHFQSSGVKESENIALMKKVCQQKNLDFLHCLGMKGSKNKKT